MEKADQYWDSAAVNDADNLYAESVEYLGNLSNYAERQSANGVKHFTIDVPAECQNIRQWGPKLDDLVDRLKEFQSDRSTVHIVARHRVQAGDHWDTQYRSMNPETFVDAIQQYGDEDSSWSMDSIRIGQVPIRGSCDVSSRHEATLTFDLDDGHMKSIKIRSVKSKNHNCLINAISQCNKTLGKGFRAQSIRDKLSLPDGAIESIRAPLIATELNCSVKVWQIVDRALSVLAQSSEILEHHADVIILDDHYWVIQSSMATVETLNFNASKQFQKEEDTAPQCTDDVELTNTEDVRLA